eukprot:TRINITY_DN8384_c0_g1_i1.p1 TRINITY_DN8384_c0_g1~~TRINITY_DN8384_c0_g1_i1.p1  ORF type:complete len:484 (-),score=139.19 TRINITY_DN8384_c0_g1_i1:21-1472(-)
MKTNVPTLLSNSLSELREVLYKDSERYDQVKKIFNGMYDEKEPSAIIRCKSISDVIEAVKTCYEKNIEITVRGGGHNIGGSSIDNDVVLIDLSKMAAVFVDPIKKVAVAQGGALLGDLDREASLYGLVTTGGLISHTGIGGYTLGGGFGYLARKHGLAIDNVLAYDIVTYEGKLLHVNEETHSDLFWALRGGGGNFGVVVQFHYRMYEQKDVFCGRWQFKITKDLLEGYVDFCKKAPREVAAFGFLAAKQFILLVVSTDTKLTEESELFSFFNKHPGKLLGMGSIMPYFEVQRMNDSGSPHGDYYWWTKSSLLKDLTGNTIDSLVELFKGDYFPMNYSIEIVPLGGAISDKKSSDTAFFYRDSVFEAHGIVRWQLGFEQLWEKKKDVEWLRKVSDILEKDSVKENAGFINIMGDLIEKDKDVEKVRLEKIKSTYGTNYEKLLQVKEKYDPFNFFFHNHNITPPKSKKFKRFSYKRTTKRNEKK